MKNGTLKYLTKYTIQISQKKPLIAPINKFTKICNKNKPVDKVLSILLIILDSDETSKNTFNNRRQHKSYHIEKKSSNPRLKKV